MVNLRIILEVRASDPIVVRLTPLRFITLGALSDIDILGGILDMYAIQIVVVIVEVASVTGLKHQVPLGTKIARFETLPFIFWLVAVDVKGPMLLGSVAFLGPYPKLERCCVSARARKSRRFTGDLPLQDECLVLLPAGRQKSPHLAFLIEVHGDRVDQCGQKLIACVWRGCHYIGQGG